MNIHESSSSSGRINEQTEITTIVISSSAQFPAFYSAVVHFENFHSICEVMEIRLFSYREETKLKNNVATSVWNRTKAESFGAREG